MVFGIKTISYDDSPNNFFTWELCDEEKNFKFDDH